MKNKIFKGGLEGQETRRSLCKLEGFFFLALHCFFAQCCAALQFHWVLHLEANGIGTEVLITQPGLVKETGKGGVSD